MASSIITLAAPSLIIAATPLVVTPVALQLSRSILVFKLIFSYAILNFLQWKIGKNDISISHTTKLDSRNHVLPFNSDIDFWYPGF